MSELKNICVYCGSGPGADPDFVQAARTLGTAMAREGIGLVYGGGNVGLMGEIAHAVQDGGGRITGIIPEFLMTRERAVRLGEMIVTKDMHERKRLMFEHADAFVALPGGVGTLEELVEQLTWAQLGQHKKPILLANINGFWDPLCTLLEHMETMQFIRAGLAVRYQVAQRIEDVLPVLRRSIAGVDEEEKRMKVPLDRT